MRRKTALPELLSPAGSFDALVAAVNAGADAVYFGGQAMNARAFAKNFDEEEIRRAVVYCHLHGAKAYVTLNTLLTDRELPDAVTYAGRLRALGVDALIVADLGLISELHKIYPDLPLHASTQASAHSADGCRRLSDLGCSRVVLARELSLADLTAATENAPPETEVFLHGALCVCHSGQCLFSSLVGGRSGNRGTCAQPCRLPYNGRERLSLRDLCLASYIPELIASGTASLKIEGRMKSPAYVAGVTAVYRRLLDEGRAATQSEIDELARLFSRGGFTDGYLTGKKDKPMTGVRSDSDKAATREVTQDATFPPIPTPVKLDCRIEAGKPSSLTLTARNRSVTVMGPIPEPARNAPLSRDGLFARLSKFGGTFFTLSESDFSLTLDEGLNLSPAALNELRRSAVSAWEQGECRNPLPEIPKQDAPKPPFPREPLLSVSCRTAEQLDAIANLLPPDAETWLPLWEEPGVTTPRGVTLPAVVFDSERDGVLSMMKNAASGGIRYALISNGGQIALCREAGLIPIGSFRLNVTNRESAAAWIDAGVGDLVLSPELPLPAAGEIGGRVIVWGHIPLMLTERCFIKENFGCDKCNKAVFRDRMGAGFPLIREYPHRNQILNGTPTCMTDRKAELAARGLNRHFILFTVEEPSECKGVLRAYLSGTLPAGTGFRRMPKTY